MDTFDETSAKLQDEILQLALKARPGSLARIALCQAGSWNPNSTDVDGGIQRKEVCDTLQRINAAITADQDPHRRLREMRNLLEPLLDRIDGFDHAL